MGQRVPSEFLVRHICDVSGVLFEVLYAGPKPYEIRSVHVLDPNYRPVGPDLTFLLHSALVLVGPGEAEHLLSKLAEELP